MAACIVGAALAAAAGAAVPTLTLTGSAPSVSYGGAVTLSGQLSTNKANQPIALEATACGSTKAVKVVTVRTNATGAFSGSVKPTIGTTYHATLKNVQSAPVAVTVKPLVELTRPVRGSFTIKVTAGQALTGKFVLFQRYKKLRKRWAQVKRVALGAAVAGATKPTMISSVSFKAKLPRGTRVRALLSTAQAGPCYVQAASKSIRA